MIRNKFRKLLTGFDVRKNGVVWHPGDPKHRRRMVCVAKAAYHADFVYRVALFR